MLQRSCHCCKQKIYLMPETIKNIICYNKQVYHCECFKKMCVEKLNAPRSKKEKWKSVLDSLDDLKSKSYEQLNNEIVKDDIYNLMIDHYKISVIPNSVFVKLEKVYSGQLKGMAVAISPSDLLDMWQQKLKFLDKVAYRNITLGKKFTPSQRIMYDISVLINKYDSYLEWKEQQKILSVNNNKKAEPLITKDIQKNVKAKEVDKDMSDLVNDIFGD